MNKIKNKLMIMLGALCLAGGFAGVGGCCGLSEDDCAACLCASISSAICIALPGVASASVTYAVTHSTSTAFAVGGSASASTVVCLCCAAYKREIMTCGEIIFYEIEEQLEIKFHDTLTDSIEMQVITDTAHVLETIRRLSQEQIELPPANRPIRVLGRVNPEEIPELIHELRRLGSDQGESSGSGLASAPIPEAMEVPSPSLLLTASAPEIMGVPGELENEPQNPTAWAQPNQPAPFTASAPQQNEMEVPGLVGESCQSE